VQVDADRIHLRCFSHLTLVWACGSLEGCIGPLEVAPLGEQGAEEGGGPAVAAV
jgi:hypothetical protein